MCGGWWWWLGSILLILLLVRVIWGVAVDNVIFLGFWGESFVLAFIIGG
jgi:hypothetical protein